MQQLVTLWHGLLKAMGGDLVPEKCCWYLIDFKWEHTHWKYTKWQDNDRDITSQRGY